MRVRRATLAKVGLVGWSGGIRAAESRRYATVSVGWGPPREAEIQQAGQLLERRLERDLNCNQEREQHLKCSHLKQVQHCTDLHLQVTLTLHIEQGKMEQGLK